MNEEQLKKDKCFIELWTDVDVCSFCDGVGIGNEELKELLEAQARVSSAEVFRLIESIPKNYKKEDWFDGDLCIEFWGEAVGWHVGYNGGEGWYEGPEATGETVNKALDNFKKLLSPNPEQDGK